MRGGSKFPETTPSSRISVDFTASTIQLITFARIGRISNCQEILMMSEQQFSTAVPQDFLKHAVPDCSVRSSDLFLDC